MLADRGIGCSPELCRAVAALGWYYLFRLTCQTKIVTESGDYTIAQQVQPGDIWAASGLVFKQRGRIPAHARALWEVGYDEPWALVTNDERLTGHEYARRNWQEQSFRDLKSGGWQWGQSRVRLPAHVERLLGSCQRLMLVITIRFTASRLTRLTPCIPPPLQRRRTGVLQRWFALFCRIVERHTVCLKCVPSRQTVHLKRCPPLSQFGEGLGVGSETEFCAP